MLNGYPNGRTYGKTDMSIGSPWQSDTSWNGWCDMSDDIMMSRCCRTCKYRLDGVKSNHTLLGSGIDIDSDMDGFICLALSYEGVAHWMLGVDEDKGICEMYKERNRR